MEREYLPGDLRQRMQDLLKERKITQAELAEKIEMSEGALSRFLSGATDKFSNENIMKTALYLDVSTDFLLGLSNFPERYNYDISELGLSHKAALALHTGAVNTDVVNRLLENARFMEITKKIGQYFNDTESEGFAAVNAMYAALGGFLQAQDHPGKDGAVRQLAGMSVPYKEMEMQTITQEFQDMLCEIKEGITTHTPVSEALTEQTARAIIEETERTGVPPTLTGDEIRQQIMEQCEAMNAVSSGFGTQLGEMLLQFADTMRETAQQHGLLPEDDEKADQ